MGRATASLDAKNGWIISVVNHTGAPSFPRFYAKEDGAFDLVKSPKAPPNWLAKQTIFEFFVC